jgi:hypothetical protein
MNVYFTARHNKLTIAYQSCTVYFMKTLQEEAKNWQAEKLHDVSLKSAFSYSLNARG